EGLVALWLARLVARARLGRQHPDVAHPLDLAVDEAVDGVTAHHLHHRPGQAPATRRRLLGPRPRGAEREQGQRDERDRPRHYFRPSLRARSSASRRSRSAASWSVRDLTCASSRCSSSACWLLRVVCSWALFCRQSRSAAKPPPTRPSTVHTATRLRTAFRKS